MDHPLRRGVWDGDSCEAHGAAFDGGDVQRWRRPISRRGALTAVSGPVSEQATAERYCPKKGGAIARPSFGREQCLTGFMRIESRQGVELQAIAGLQAGLELIDHIGLVQGRRVDAAVRGKGAIRRVHAVIDRDPVEVRAVAARQRRRGLFAESISKKGGCLSAAALGFSTPTLICAH